MLREIQPKKPSEDTRQKDEYMVEYREEPQRALWYVPNVYSKYVLPSNRFTRRLGAA